MTTRQLIVLFFAAGCSLLIAAGAYRLNHELRRAEPAAAVVLVPVPVPVALTPSCAAPAAPSASAHPARRLPRRSSTTAAMRRHNHGF